MASARIFYGWWVTLAFAVMIFLSTGIRFTVGPFLKPKVAELGLDRASFSLVIAVSLSIFGTTFLIHQAGGALGALGAS